MFEDKFATYNMVEPPKFDSDFFNTNFINNRINNDFIVGGFMKSNNLNTTTSEPIEETEEIDESSKVVSEKKVDKAKKISKKVDTLKGPESFEKYFAQAVKEDPSIAPYKNFLIKTAKRESGFNYSIQNTAGAPYYGYFQFGESALKTVSNMSMSEFRKDPVAQIKCAVKLYKVFINEAKRLGIYDLAKSKGYSDDSIAAGAWLGGIGGVKKYLLGQGNPSDSHWYGGKGGSSVGKRMEEFK